jgi:hypothetical protein
VSLVLNNHQQVIIDWKIIKPIVLHKKASTTTQSKLAEYIKGANKGKGIKAVGGYGTVMKGVGGSMHGNQ